jgi:ubiquinone biosynthesis protein COQ4
MHLVANLRRATELYRRNKQAHLADIAVLKSEAFGVREHPRLRGRLDAVRGYMPPIELDRLAALPEGTFGHAYAGFMRENGLAPFRLSDEIDRETRNRNAYAVRWAITHDMFHTLLGFDTSLAGEIGVLAFTLAQRQSRLLWASMVMACLVYPFWSGFRIAPLWRAVRRGYRLGKRAELLIALRLEDWFHRDLDELRRELGLTACSQ